MVMSFVGFGKLDPLYIAHQELALSISKCDLQKFHAMMSTIDLDPLFIMRTETSSVKSKKIKSKKINISLMDLALHSMIEGFDREIFEMIMVLDEKGVKATPASTDLLLPLVAAFLEDHKLTQNRSYHYSHLQKEQHQKNVFVVLQRIQHQGLMLGDLSGAISLVKFLGAEKAEELGIGWNKDTQTTFVISKPTTEQSPEKQQLATITNVKDQYLHISGVRSDQLKFFSTVTILNLYFDLEKNEAEEVINLLTTTSHQGGVRLKLKDPTQKDICLVLLQELGVISEVDLGFVDIDNPKLSLKEMLGQHRENQKALFNDLPSNIITTGPSIDTSNHNEDEAQENKHSKPPFKRLFRSL